jgi:hypothetical protein
VSRIRSIKPEFWASEQVMSCTHSARLLFIGLWNFCDDCGHHPLALRQIKALVFPGDDYITGEQVQDMIDEFKWSGVGVLGRREEIPRDHRLASPKD